MSISANSMQCLPFNNIDVESIDSISAANETVTDYNQSNHTPLNNNDYLADIDPDQLNCKLGKKCKYYSIPEFNYAIPKELKCPVSMIATNIRSSNQNLKNFLNYISQLKVNWTFISVTENWGKLHTICHMHIPGYKHVYNVRTDRIGGGCSLYIHDAILFKQKKVLKLGGESVFIEVNGKIFNTNKNVLLAVIYRSPDSPLGLFNEQLEHTLLQIDKEKKVA